MFRPATGTWLVKDQYTQVWGAAGDVPVPIDRNGDGVAELGVFRRATGTWYFKNHVTDANETRVVRRAPATSRSAARMPPVQTPWGDYDGDRKADLTVFRPSTGDWVSLRSLSGMTDYTLRTFGLSGDVPVGRDYDGDGKIDLAVYPAVARPLVRAAVVHQLHAPTSTQDWGLADRHAGAGRLRRRRQGRRRGVPAVARALGDSAVVHRQHELRARTTGA